MSSQGLAWQPVQGDETSRLLEYLGLPDSSASTVKEEAAYILSRCVPPAAASGRETGLVIGYIQSGKTMSFTAVAALAHDNGYRLIVVISGITTNLFEQSAARLERDLQLRTRSDRKWQFLRNPRPRPEEAQRIAMALDWDDSLPGFEKQTVLITVMKNRTHLNNLAKLLIKVSTVGIPTLVIDDEGDQASLNNLVQQGDESATYRRIVQIRRLLPHHTFLQYTATPQALLLINLIDVLSPGFVGLLTPGPAYVGGKTFFEQEFRLVRRIPRNEVPSKEEVLSEPPNTLLEALRVFYLGVAAGLLDGAQGNRSMLVHPAKETAQHASYVKWIRSIQQTWSNTLGQPSTDPDKQDLMAEFQETYADLCDTASNLPPFSELEPYLRGAVKRTIVVEVNAARGRTPQIDWRQNYAFILVGGEVLNRGYTVEGLTVTYMPRGQGVGNADTIQQRARWFGYKADYLGLCRVYLADTTLSAYVSYVNHEENVREQMRALLALGGSVRDWRRAFFLSSELRPTRHEVLDKEYLRGNFSNAWFEERAPHDSEEAIVSNRDVVREFLAQVELAPDEGRADRTEVQRHKVAQDASLGLVYRELLTKFRMPRPSDSQRFTGVLLQIGAYLETCPDATCTVYQMSHGVSRRRSLNDNEEVPNLFQGPDPDKTGERYPGDRQIRSRDGLTVQLHNLNIYTDAGQEGILVAEGVPTLAVWVPKEMSGDWVVQD